MTACPGIEKMLALYFKLQDEKASTVQTTLGRFFTKKENIFILSVSDAQNYSVLN